MQEEGPTVSTFKLERSGGVVRGVICLATLTSIVLPSPNRGGHCWTWASMMTFAAVPCCRHLLGLWGVPGAACPGEEVEKERVAVSSCTIALVMMAK